MTTHVHTITRAARPFLRFGLAELFTLARQRSDLAALDARQLDDLGLTRQEAETEARRPFWDVPASWRS